MVLFFIIKRERGYVLMCIYDIETIHIRIRYNIKRLREMQSKSQLEMALAIGHSSAGFYAKAELGIQNKKFNIEHLCKIAEVLEVEIYEFFKEIVHDENVV
jgi:transcriptional regulator with XRE-family HTH domain